MWTLIHIKNENGNQPNCSALRTEIKYQYNMYVEHEIYKIDKPQKHCAKKEIKF